MNIPRSPSCLSRVEVLFLFPRLHFITHVKALLFGKNFCASRHRRGSYFFPTIRPAFMYGDHLPSPLPKSLRKLLLLPLRAFSFLSSFLLFFCFTSLTLMWWSLLTRGNSPFHPSELQRCLRAYSGHKSLSFLPYSERRLHRQVPVEPWTFPGRRLEQGCLMSVPSCERQPDPLHIV